MPLLVYLNRAISTIINNKTNYLTGQHFSNTLNMDEHVFFHLLHFVHSKTSVVGKLGFSKKKLYWFLPVFSFPEITFLGVHWGNQVHRPGDKENCQNAETRTWRGCAQHILVGNVVLVGYCTKYRPLQHRNIKFIIIIINPLTAVTL